MSTPRNNRPGAGPGRGKPRSRTGVKSAALQTGKPDETPEDRAPVRGGGVITRRAIAVIVVAALLLISYGSSLRIWLETEQENATNRAAIQRSEQRIAELNADLARWDDPDYVRAQARDRLGWVMPGDTGYRVLGPNGEPIGTQLDKPGSDPAAPDSGQWWQRMWRSVEAADRPVPTPGTTPTPTAEPKPPITDGTRTPKPTVSPTPKRTPTPSKSPTPSRTPTPSKTPTATNTGER